HRWCCRILTLRHRSSIGHISRHYIRYQVPLLDRELHRCIYSPPLGDGVGEIIGELGDDRVGAGELLEVASLLAFGSQSCL
ncbi:hypothetical protein, partial [Nocardia gamkensis]|uniref:hypothetical protein n=1 Tax=Nocardia gamkensis TaxID=352869 RepID=UPI001B34C66D